MVCIISSKTARVRRFANRFAYNYRRTVIFMECLYVFNEHILIRAEIDLENNVSNNTTYIRRLNDVEIISELHFHVIVFGTVIITLFDNHRLSDRYSIYIITSRRSCIRRIDCTRTFT